MTMTEISSRMGLSKATGYRYVSALRSAGLLRHDESRGDYSLGTLILNFASAALAGLPLISTAEPVMERLVRITGETAVLSIWDGGSPVVVRVNDNSERAVTVRVRTGYRLGPNAAQSQIYLEHGFTIRTNDGNTHALDSVPDNPGTVYVHTNPSLGTRTVAAPVYLGSRLEAVLGLIGTTSTIPDSLDSDIAKALVAGADAVSSGLPDQESSDKQG